jgi:hypothetical protein
VTNINIFFVSFFSLTNPRQRQTNYRRKTKRERKRAPILTLSLTAPPFLFLFLSPLPLRCHAASANTTAVTRLFVLPLGSYFVQSNFIFYSSCASCMTRHSVTHFSLIPPPLPPQPYINNLYLGLGTPHVCRPALLLVVEGIAF